MATLSKNKNKTRVQYYINIKPKRREIFKKANTRHGSLTCMFHLSLSNKKLNLIMGSDYEFFKADNASFVVAEITASEAFGR